MCCRKKLSKFLCDMHPEEDALFRTGMRLEEESQESDILQEEDGQRPYLFYSSSLDGTGVPPDTRTRREPTELTLGMARYYLRRFRRFVHEPLIGTAYVLAKRIEEAFHGVSCASISHLQNLFAFIPRFVHPIKERLSTCTGSRRRQ
jgi:hypothetical protein